MVRVVCLGSYDPELKSHSAVVFIPGGVDSACHPSEVGKMIASLLVSCVRVATCPGLCPIVKENVVTMDGWMDGLSLLWEHLLFVKKA